MKLCVFADIHGNAAAFRAASAAIRDEAADLNIFLGDLCGYYYDQVEVLETLVALPRLAAVRGNHDQMFLRICAGDAELRQTYRQKYGLSMEHLLEAGPPAALVEWLAALPLAYSRSEDSLAAFHGSPWDALEEYIYPDAPLERFAESAAAVTLLGHTHRPMDRTVGAHRVINPGSLGQPRHGGWPTYAVADLATGEVAFREVPYDLEALRRRIAEVGDDNAYLGTVLERIGKQVT